MLRNFGLMQRNLCILSWRVRARRRLARPTPGITEGRRIKERDDVAQERMQQRGRFVRDAPMPEREPIGREAIRTGA
jgi:hypothetical protein